MYCVKGGCSNNYTPLNQFFLVEVLCILLFTVSSGSFSVNEDASVQIAAEEAVPVDYLDKDVSFI